MDGAQAIVKSVEPFLKRGREEADEDSGADEDSHHHSVMGGRNGGA